MHYSMNFITSECQAESCCEDSYLEGGSHQCWLKLSTWLVSCKQPTCCFYVGNTERESTDAQKLIHHPSVNMNQECFCFIVMACCQTTSWSQWLHTNSLWWNVKVQHINHRKPWLGLTEVCRAQSLINWQAHAWVSFSSRVSGVPTIKLLKSPYYNGLLVQVPVTRNKQFFFFSLLHILKAGWGNTCLPRLNFFIYCYLFIYF